jgi:phage gp29-like protein
MSGWGRYTTGLLKKEKQRLSSIVDDIEAFAEVRPLTAQEIELKNQSNTDISKLLREEELKWYQRSKSQFIFGSKTLRMKIFLMSGAH